MNCIDTALSAWFHPTSQCTQITGVCAVQHRRLFAAVAFQSKKQVIENAGYRAADFARVSMQIQA